MAEIQRYKPSSSPLEPKGDFVSIITKLNRAIKVGEIEEKDLEDVAQRIFEILIECDDKQVLSGEIPLNLASELNVADEKITQKDLELYLKIANSLFKLANNKEINAVKVLTPELVKNFDIKAAALAQVKGGNLLLRLLCDIVNQEISDRTPSSISVFSSSALKTSNNQDKSKI